MSFTVENFFKLLDMAYKYDIQELKNKCIFQLFDAKPIVENYYKVLEMASMTSKS